MQPRRANAPLDRRSAQSQRPQLCVPDDAALALGERCDPMLCCALRSHTDF
jgi:hypothetical protein